jgi:GxxExxY protein
MEKEFEPRKVPTGSKVPTPLYYKGFATGKAYEMDMLVASEIVPEFKAVDILHPIFSAQWISYLKLYDKRLDF